MIHVLTSRPKSVACRAFVGRARALGVPAELVQGGSFQRGDVVFAYGATRRLLAGVAVTSDRFVNCVRFDKRSQYERLSRCAIPVPEWEYLGTDLVADKVERLGYPVVLKPNDGSFGRGVRVVARRAELEGTSLRRPYIAQRFVPCGGQCARVLVVGGRVVAAMNRIAKDGRVASYAGGAKAWLEPIELTDREIELCSAACAALGIGVGGVDLLRSAEGPFILEVNHQQVPFFLREVYGDGLTDVVRYLDSLRDPFEISERTTPRTAAGLSAGPHVGSWVRRNWNPRRTGRRPTFRSSEPTA